MHTVGVVLDKYSKKITLGSENCLKTPILDLIKISQLVSEKQHADIQTDRQMTDSQNTTCSIINGQNVLNP